MKADSHCSQAVVRSCPALCGACTLACEDRYSDCPNWAESVGGVCEGAKNEQFMLKECPHSCGVCTKLHVFPGHGHDEL